MGVCGCVIPNPNCHCHSMPDYLVTMPKSVLDQIGKEHTEKLERLRQQNAELSKALNHCVNALSEFEKDSKLPTDQFQYSVVFKLKGFLLGALDNARLATGGE